MKWKWVNLVNQWVTLIFAVFKTKTKWNWLKVEGFWVVLGSFYLLRDLLHNFSYRFILYKLPRVHNSSNQLVRQGLGFASILPDSKDWQLSARGIDHPQSPAGNTLQPLYDGNEVIFGRKECKKLHANGDENEDEELWASIIIESGKLLEIEVMRWNELWYGQKVDQLTLTLDTGKKVEVRSDSVEPVPLMTISCSLKSDHWALLMGLCNRAEGVYVNDSLYKCDQYSYI